MFTKLSAGIRISAKKSNERKSKNQSSSTTTATTATTRNHDSHHQSFYKNIFKTSSQKFWKANAEVSSQSPATFSTFGEVKRTRSLPGNHEVCTAPKTADDRCQSKSLKNSAKNLDRLENENYELLSFANGSNGAERLMKLNERIQKEERLRDGADKLLTHSFSQCYGNCLCFHYHSNYDFYNYLNHYSCRCCRYYSSYAYF
ncbi:hypothetical protein HELRODRAFT_160864 [Helobdella robusta]|uniref:Uncharacterized protein n=1 Tax=Helobdella robusta TaxID=6412 RepID=T1EQT8_HELRO|nr:hypothetical protein HELRODRAFT_160864 [Helobdella robusta]ESO06671.1 hypothetical protein HELRODRAFT_160864 [Helobdella robusta]